MSGKKNKKVQTFVMARTPEQESFVNQLNAARKAVKIAKEIRDQFAASCKHSIAYTIDTRWGEDWPEGTCWCDICDMHFGHYCPKSPDHGCHYYSEDGKVKLNDGSVVDKPRDPDVPECDWAADDAYETDDVCLFCGSPNERK